MTNREIDAPILGPGAKVVGGLVIAVAAFGLGYSTGLRHNGAGEAHQLDQRLEEMNRTMFQRISVLQKADADRARANSPAGGEVASAVDPDVDSIPAGK